MSRKSAAPRQLPATNAAWWITSRPARIASAVASGAPSPGAISSTSRPRSRSRCQVRALVLAAALGDQLGVRPRDPLQQDLAAGAREVQRRPVLAGEEVVEVARGEQEASAALQHRRHLPGAERPDARPGTGAARPVYQPDMRTPLVLLAIAAVALGPAAAASAKEIDKVKVCGADGCHDVTDRATMAVTDGGPPTAWPDEATPFYRVKISIKGRGRRERPGLELPVGARGRADAGEDGTWTNPPSTTVDELKR